MTNPKTDPSVDIGDGLKLIMPGDMVEIMHGQQIIDDLIALVDAVTMNGAAPPVIQSDARYLVLSIEKVSEGFLTVLTKHGPTMLHKTFIKKVILCPR